MKLLFQLIWRHNFTLFFILLEGLCIYLLVRNNRFQQASFLNATNAVVTTAMQGVNYIKEYVQLRENNMALANENARLRNELNSASYEKDSAQVVVNDTNTLQQYQYITARVVNNSVNHRNNFITLNKGSLQGIKPEMGVIGPDGIVGIVNHVSEHFCTVMSLLHKETNVSAMLSRNGFYGSLRWEGGNPHYVYLREIDKTVPVLKGDTVVTTAFSSIFPAGVMIGRVAEANVEPGSPFFKIKVRLSMSFSNLNYVYIVNNLLKEEQQGLESNNKPKEDEP